MSTLDCPDGDSGCSFDEGNEESSGNPKAEANSHSNSAILRIGIDGPDAMVDATFVDRCLAKLFRRIGHWIGRWPVPLVVVLLSISLLFSSIIPFTPQQDDLKNGYTPNGAPSRRELAQYEAHFRSSAENIQIGQKGEPISLLVFVQARDNGTLLREEYLLEMVKLIDELANHFPLGGRSFAEFCSDFCQLNEPIRQFTNGFLIHQRQLAQGDRLNLSFPFMSILGHQIDLSPHFFDTKLGPDGQLTHFRLALLQFKADPLANVSRLESLQWERRIVHFLHQEYKGLVRPLAFTMGFVADEVIRTGMTLFPFLSVGFAIMCLFSVATVAFSAAYFRQFTPQKVFIAIIACCCPLLACAAALGLLFWAGLRFGTILCVSPFLVLAIGVDDAFLMLQSWQRICGEKERTKSSAKGDLELLSKRVGQMLEDVGPSITITSATNVFAFCIGIFTPTPEIQLFCTGTATAILFDYIFQIFLFTPCLAIAGKFEMQNEGRKGGNEGPGKMEIWIQNFRILLRQQLSAFMRAYCRWIANGFTFFFVSTFLLLYWIFSAKHALGVVPNITPRKLLLADSILNEVVTLKDKYILPNYMPVSIFVENVGDLRDKKRNERIKSLISEFEDESNNLGPAFTHFWLREYEQFLNNEFAEEEGANEQNTTSNPFSQVQMASFLEWPEYRHWNGFLRFRNGQLDRFFVITAFHGPELVEWNIRAKLLARWRQIVAKYADDLGAFIWVDEAQFLDQIESLIPATIQSSIATLVCMSLICSLFMSNLMTVILATISIVSICLGAFGLLVVWGICLDPISMATTIMSIGFSVDFPAHIAYHYYRYGKSAANNADCPEERVHAALLSIGFPLIQCGMSTIFFVLCLLFVDTYMSEVFVKSMFLVVSLGLVHGLFIVPTMLCAISKINSLLESKKRIQNSARRKNSIKNQKIERKGSSKLVVSIAGPG